MEEATDSECHSQILFISVAGGFSEVFLQGYQTPLSDPKSSVASEHPASTGWASEEFSHGSPSTHPPTPVLVLEVHTGKLRSGAKVCTPRVLC